MHIQQQRLHTVRQELYPTQEVKEVLITLLTLRKCTSFSKVLQQFMETIISGLSTSLAKKTVVDQITIIIITIIMVAGVVQCQIIITLMVEMPITQLIQLTILQIQEITKLTQEKTTQITPMVEVTTPILQIILLVTIQMLWILDLNLVIINRII